MHIMGFNYLTFFSTRANDFLVGYVFGPAELGYFTMAYGVLNAMTQILIRTSQDVALPTFSRLQEDPERFRRAFYSATQLTITLATPTFLGMAMLAPELVRVLFGEQWLPAVPLMQVLALLGILRSITFFKSSVLIALGKANWLFWLTILEVLLSFLAFAISYRWGIFAVALATVIRAYLFFPVGQWAICKLMPDSLGKYFRVFIVPTVCSLIMAAAVFFVRQGFTDSLYPLSLIALGTLTGAIVYAIAMRFLAPELLKQVIEITQIIARGSKVNSD